MAPNIQIQRLSPANTDHLIQLVELYETVFEMEPAPKPPAGHYARLLSDPDLMVVVALCDDRVIGGVTIHGLPSYHRAGPVAYAQDLAVERGHQRMGIGRRLMEFAMGLCARNGFSELFIQAEHDDADAIAFYRSLPVSEELGAVHFSFRLP